MDRLKQNDQVLLTDSEYRAFLALIKRALLLSLREQGMIPEALFQEAFSLVL